MELEVALSHLDDMRTSAPTCSAAPESLVHTGRDSDGDIATCTYVPSYLTTFAIAVTDFLPLVATVPSAPPQGPTPAPQLQSTASPRTRMIKSMEQLKSALKMLSRLGAEVLGFELGGFWSVGWAWEVVRILGVNVSIRIMQRVRGMESLIFPWW
jgi:hypothetical protein